MSAQSGHELNVADASIDSTLHRSVHLCRRRNLLASPLPRLPTELILKIFVHVTELDGDDGDDDDGGYGDDDDGGYGHGFDCDNHAPSLFVLTAICHQLRKIGIASSQLWSIVDLTTPPIAELFLERCKYDPHTLIKFPSLSENLSMHPIKNPGRDATWEKLEGHTFTGFALSRSKGHTTSSLLETSTFATPGINPRNFRGPSAIQSTTSPPFASVNLRSVGLRLSFET